MDKRKTNKRTDEFSNEFLNDDNIESYGQSKGAYLQYQARHSAAAQNSFSQRPQGSYCSDPRQAMGGGDSTIEDLKSKYFTDNKMPQRKRPPSKRESNSSNASDVTIRTAYDVKKRGTNMLKLTESKASFLKTFGESMSGTQEGNCGSNKAVSPDRNRYNPRETYRCGCEEPKAGSSSSAGLINEKIIHPMVKKFRLLYLHNIKEEVSIMEDLEMLPHKLDEVCKAVEKR